MPRVNERRVQFFPVRPLLGAVLFWEATKWTPFRKEYQYGSLSSDDDLWGLNILSWE